MSDELPPMESLASIMDQMREFAQTELPTPRTCRVQLWDDGTFDACIFHSMGKDERQQTRYERTTIEIVWKHMRGVRREKTQLSGGETLHESVVEETQIHVLTSIEPLYK